MSGHSCHFPCQHKESTSLTPDTQTLNILSVLPAFCEHVDVCKLHCRCPGILVTSFDRVKNRPQSVQPPVFVLAFNNGARPIWSWAMQHRDVWRRMVGRGNARSGGGTSLVLLSNRALMQESGVYMSKAKAKNLLLRYSENSSDRCLVEGNGSVQ